MPYNFWSLLSGYPVHVLIKFSNINFLFQLFLCRSWEMSSLRYLSTLFMGVREELTHSIIFYLYWLNNSGKGSKIKRIYFKDAARSETSCIQTDIRALFASLSNKNRPKGFHRALPGRKSSNCHIQTVNPVHLIRRADLSGTR